MCGGEIFSNQNQRACVFKRGSRKIRLSQLFAKDVCGQALRSDERRPPFRVAMVIQVGSDKRALAARLGERRDQGNDIFTAQLRSRSDRLSVSHHHPAPPVELDLEEGDNRGAFSPAPGIAAEAHGEARPLAPEIADEIVDEDEAGELERGPVSAAEDLLVERSLAGDEDAFESLVRQHSPRVFSIIGSFFRRRDQIEDIAQEVFAKAFFSLATFTLGRSFEAWVAKIAVNTCYDQLRAQRRRGEQQTPHESQEEDGWLELQMLSAARARHMSNERQRDAAEIADRLLSKLEPEDRLVVVLIDRDGYSVKEVSDLTGWSQSKVKVRAFRARRVLRGAMKRLLISGERMQRSKK